MDIPLYSKSKGRKSQILGAALYRLFDSSSFCLHAQMRQAGSENEEFKDQLERVANGTFSIKDWESWKTQDLATMVEPTSSSFTDEATMLCARKVDMISFNTHHLKKTGNPIAKLKAENSPGASAFDSESAQGLRNTLFLSKGARVVLTSNLWTEAKLVNGSNGIVEYLVYKEGADSSKDLPSLVICHFPAYTGPSFLPGSVRLVPIVPKTVTWYSKGLQYSRSQFSLILSWALTIHKSQGIKCY